MRLFSILIQYPFLDDPFDECDIKNKFGQVINVFTKSGQHMVHFQRLTEEAVVDKSFHKVCFLSEN